MSEHLIGVIKAAKILDCCAATARRMARDGEIPSRRRGTHGRWKFFASELTAHMQAKATHPALSETSHTLTCKRQS